MVQSNDQFVTRNRNVVKIRINEVKRLKKTEISKPVG